MGRVAGTPHDPNGSTSGSASEGEKLNRGISVESGDGDDSVLDGRGGTSTHSEGTGHFKDQA